MNPGNRRSLEYAIKKLADTHKRDWIELFAATVVSYDGMDGYDGDPQTCSVTGRSGVQIPNVGLTAAVCDGLVLYPSLGSTVMVVKSTYNSYFVVQYSEIDKLYLQIGDSQLILWSGNNDFSTSTDHSIITLNGGGLGPLPVVGDENSGLVKQLNNIEKDINNLKTQLSAATTAPGDGGAALKASLSGWYSATLGTTAAGDIQNTNITQG